MAKEDVVMPIVHLNGTSKDGLLKLREDAYTALNAATDALRQMSPNGRDYYPEPGRMQKAETQHRRRVQAIRDIMREIEEECELINAQ